MIIPSPDFHTHYFTYRYRSCFSLVKEKFIFFGKIREGIPLIIVVEGKPLTKRMEQIKFAILEKDGKISIVPY